MASQGVSLALIGWLEAQHGGHTFGPILWAVAEHRQITGHIATPDKARGNEMHYVLSNTDEHKRHASRQYIFHDVRPSAWPSKQT